MAISSYQRQLLRRLMAEPVLRRGTELQQRTINSLYPIAVRYNAALPRCFMQYKDYTNSPTWEGTLKLQDMRQPTQKEPKVMKLIADQPVPLCCSLYYYEVNITAKSQCGALRVGFAFDDSDKAKYHRYTNFLGYHSNTGRIYLNDGEPMQGDENGVALGPPFGVGDVIGCGVNFVNNSIFFTKNGIFIFTTTLQTKLMNAVTIPCVMFISPTTALIANFGQRDFSFAIVQHLAQERCNAVTQAIEDKLTADLANVEMQRLVFDYLMRNGYLATAKAMARPSTVPRPSSVASSVKANGTLAGSESASLVANAPATNTNSALESFSSTSSSRSPQSQDLNNGITDQDALDSANPKSSTTQPNPPQVKISRHSSNSLVRGVCVCVLHTHTGTASSRAFSWLDVLAVIVDQNCKNSSFSMRGSHVLEK
ncbi:hypothetical protein Aperf_G00000014956 [Anoplocephala perfoliata]